MRQLAEKIDPASQPVLGLLTLTRALRVAGEEVLAERLLRAAIDARPREVVLYHTLSQLLQEQEPPRWAEAVEFYRAARGLRPDLGLSLAVALRRSGSDRGGLALLDRMVTERPDNPFLHCERGRALWDKRDLEGALEGAIACYKKAIELNLKNAMAHYNLGAALAAKGRPDEAITEYQRAIELNPKDAIAHNNLGVALERKGRPDEAITECQRAIALEPKFGGAHYNLGLALAAKGNLDDAIACYKKAIALEPKLAQAHSDLGVALANKGDVDGAIAEFRKAIELNPNYADPHSHLGVALRAKGDVDGAIAEYRKAIELNPKHAEAHNNLGNAVKAKGNLDDAIAFYKKAIALEPKNAEPHNNLGVALYDKHDVDGAIAEYRKAIELNPKHATAHNNLGAALHAKGDLDGAIICYRQAIELNPKYAPAHNNLGNALRDKGDLKDAIARYRQTIDLDPKFAHPRRALGQALLMQGHYAEAHEWTRSALRLLPQSHPLHRIAATQLQRCEQCLALDKKLPAVLQGEASPVNPAEAVALAQMCQQHKKRHVAAARLYADAFAAESKMAADLNAQHRYNAARSAALAAAGQGEDARLLSDKVVAMFRRWALGWLRDDLTAYDKIAQQNNPQVKQAIQQRLTHWQRDPDLASLRDKDAVDKLPETERDGCRKLWADVADLLKRTQEK